MVELPSLLEYASFVHFCCGGTIGPFLDFKDYKDFIELVGPYKDLPRGLKNGWATLIPSLIELVKALGCLAINVGFIMGLDMSVYFCGTKEFANYGPFWKKFIYFNLAVTG